MKGTRKRKFILLYDKISRLSFQLQTITEIKYLDIDCVFFYVLKSSKSMILKIYSKNIYLRDKVNLLMETLISRKLSNI